jgi:hypothetical protein
MQENRPYSSFKCSFTPVETSLGFLTTLQEPNGTTSFHVFATEVDTKYKTRDTANHLLGLLKLLKAPLRLKSSVC